MLSYKKLDVYRCSIELLAIAAEILEALPKGNATLADQLRRASLSVPLNIAEGAGKMTERDKSRYFLSARGSAMECAAIIEAASVLGLVEQERAARTDELITRIVGMLTRLARFR